MTDKDTALRLALEYVELVPDDRYSAEHIDQDALITAIKAALSGEAQTRSVVKDEPVGLIESLKDAKPCCGQYETCWRACTPRGKFIGQRDAQRTWVGLTDEECLEASLTAAQTLVTPITLSGVQIHVARVIEAKLKEKNGYA